MPCARLLHEARPRRMPFFDDLPSNLRWAWGPSLESSRASLLRPEQPVPTPRMVVPLRTVMSAWHGVLPPSRSPLRRAKEGRSNQTRPQTSRRHSGPSSFLCALCGSVANLLLSCWPSLSAWHEVLPSKSANRRDAGNPSTSLQQSFLCRSPLGMGSMVHSLIRQAAPTAPGNSGLTSRFVPVVKTRTFCLQTGTKPVQCSPHCPLAWVGLKKGERHVAG